MDLSHLSDDERGWVSLQIEQCKRKFGCECEPEILSAFEVLERAIAPSRRAVITEKIQMGADPSRWLILWHEDTCRLQRLVMADLN